MSQPNSPTGNCKAKKGMLVLRECGQPAIGACGGCGIPICAAHQVIGFNNQVLCPDCAARDQNMKPTGYVGRSRRRDRYYSYYGYMPLYHHHYHDHDYNTVADSAAQTPIAAAAEGAPPDRDDFDSMES
jgi:hypothetical protein